MTNGALTPLHDDLWVATRPLRLAVGDVGCRMTVVRLPGGGLVVHSPVALDEATRDALDRLGPVTAIVGPSKVHHFYLRDYVLAYPGAELMGVPGLAAKRRDLPFQRELSDDVVPAFEGALEQRLFRGAPLMNEAVFFHAASRTLILTDLAFNVPAGGPNRARLFHWLVGATGRFGPHRIVRFGIRDRTAARASLDAILRWDFDRVIVSHGEVLETGGKAALRDSFAWL